MLTSNNLNNSDRNNSRNNSASTVFIEKSLLTSDVATTSQTNKNSFYSLTDRDRQTLNYKKETRINKKPKIENKVIKAKYKMTSQEKDQYIRMVAESNSGFHDNIMHAITLSNKLISNEAIDHNKHDKSDNEEDSNENDSDDDNYRDDDDDGLIQANPVLTIKSTGSNHKYQFATDMANNDNNNNDGDNIEDTTESMITKQRISHLKSNKINKSIIPSSDPEDLVQTSRRSTRSHKLPSKVSKELKKAGANYRANN